MNPSCDVCKTSYSGLLPTKICSGADACFYVFQVDIISSDHSILFHFVPV